MKKFLQILAVFVIGVAPVVATNYAPEDIIERARSTVGTAEKLDALVTLKLRATLEPAGTSVPAATLLIFARKPCSQRLEIRVGDMVETTILNGRKGCLVRSNLEVGASQMRVLADAELARVRYTTRQFFNFYRPDFKNGEKVAYEGTHSYRGHRVHKLRYAYSDGLETIRYFSVNEDELLAVVSENDIESINIGQQVIDGITYPERIDYYENDEKLHSVILHQVQINKPLPAGIFEIPSESEK